jgi:hypothetical protein
MDSFNNNQFLGDEPVDSSPNGHLSDTQVMMFIDGEDSGREASLVRAHLKACWPCRVRREKMEEAITNVVEYRNLQAAHFMPPRAERRARFTARREQLAAQLNRPPLLGFGVNLFTAVKQAVSRPVWISAMVTAAVGLVVMIAFLHTPVISASELLHRAQESEWQVLKRAVKPVVFRKIRIQTDHQSVTRTLYHDPVGNRWADHVEITGKQSAEISNTPIQNVGSGVLEAQNQLCNQLRQEFLSAQLNWQDPLSASAYASWRNNLPSKRDEVTREPHDLISLTTQTADGPIAEARLSVRASDYHPVAESIRLQDNRHIEITELAFDVLNLDSISPTIFLMVPSPKLIPPVVASAAPPLPPPPSESELEESEVQARVALHTLRADLGEPIEVVLTDREVQVRGLAETPERKAQLIDGLNGIASLSVQIRTIGEARNTLEDSQQSSTPPQRQPLMREGVRADRTKEYERIVSDRLPIQDYLEKYFREHRPQSDGAGKAEAADSDGNIQKDIQKLSDQALSCSDAAVSEAWALRRLAKRYTPEELAKLSPKARQQLEDLVRDNLKNLRVQIEKTRSLIAPVLATVPNQGEVDQETTAITKLSGLDWPDFPSTLFECMNNIDRLMSSLFGGSEFPMDVEGARSGQGPLRLKPPEKYVGDLLWLLNRVEDHLARLETKTAGPFLASH